MYHITSIYVGIVILHLQLNMLIIYFQAFGLKRTK